MKKSKRKNSKFGLIIIPIIILLIAIIVVVYYFIGLGNSKVTLNVDGGVYEGKVVIENNKIVSLPIPTKDGYVFWGWEDIEGNKVEINSEINGELSLNAVWLKYVCPVDCVVNDDGKTCSKQLTTKVTKKTGCPSGYTLKDNQCLNLSTRYYAENIDTSPWWKCKSSADGAYDEIFGGGAIKYCAKKTNKITTETCPNGYTLENGICTKIQIINCNLEK